MMLNRGDEALRENEIALSLDPLLIPANANRGIILLLLGKQAEARRELERAIPLTPSVPFGSYSLGGIEAREGRYAAALRHFQTAYNIAPGYVGVSGALAYTYARLGRRAESDSILASLRRVELDDRSRIQLAWAEAMGGDLDRAFAILEQQTTWDIPTVLQLRVNPLLAELRADPRYRQLLAKIGLRP